MRSKGDKQKLDSFLRTGIVPHLYTSLIDFHHQPHQPRHRVRRVFKRRNRHQAQPHEARRLHCRPASDYPLAWN